jgi:RNA polymerase sigma-70 factor, ECF subfamily
MTRHASPDGPALLAEGELRHRKAARIGSGMARRSGWTRVRQARGDQQRNASQRNAPAHEEDPSDTELLKRHVSGDPHAFGELFGRHRDRLWAVAVRTLSDPEEAADALQDAMIAALRRADSFRGDSAVTTWLYRIVVNAALDRMRRRAARPTTACQDEEALDALATGGQSLPDPSNSSDTTIDVRAALQRLVPEQQAALVLVDMLGYPVADAAQVLGVSEGTVKSRAARGRARLRSRLAHLRPGAVPGHDRRTRPAAGRLLPAPTN